MHFVGFTARSQNVKHFKFRFRYIRSLHVFYVDSANYALNYGSAIY